VVSLNKDHKLEETSSDHSTQLLLSFKIQFNTRRLVKKCDISKLMVMSQVRNISAEHFLSINNSSEVTETSSPTTTSSSRTQLVKP
jgi:hypothetical protein